MPEVRYGGVSRRRKAQRKVVLSVMHLQLCDLTASRVVSFLFLSSPISSKVQARSQTHFPLLRAGVFLEEQETCTAAARLTLKSNGTLTFIADKPGSMAIKHS